MTYMENPDLSGFLTAVAENCEAIFEINIREETYRTLQCSSILGEIIPEKGQFRLIFQTFFMPDDTPSEITQEYTDMIYRDILRNRLCHRRIQFIVNNVVFIRMFSWFAGADQDIAYCTLTRIQYPEISESRISRKEYALSDTYLSSMFVDLDNNHCSAIHVPEIDAPDHNTIEMPYTTWRKMIAKAIDDDNRNLFLTLTDPEHVRQELLENDHMSFDIQMKNVSDNYIWVRHTMRKVPDPESGHLQFIHTVRDIDADKKMMMAKIRHIEDQSAYDALTASWARTRMDEYIRESIVNAEETGIPFYLLHIGQTNLIRIFSANQFREADKLLSDTANLVRAVIPENMTFGRWTNTSLVILCRNADEEETDAFCRKLLSTYAELTSDRDSTLRLSIGSVCVHPGDTLESVHQLLEQTLSHAMESSQSTVVSDSDLKKNISRPGSRQILDQIEEHIHLNYMQKMTLRDLSRRYYINSAYLGQLFIKRYHVSFSEYLCRERLSHAAHELLTTDRLVYEIAASVGYTNLNYFIRQFTEHYGCPPSRYRKEHMDD